MSIEENSKKSANSFKVMRSRIRYSTYAKLEKIAELESERTGRQIYVADLVREACRRYINDHIALKPTLDGSDSSNTGFYG